MEGVDLQKIFNERKRSTMKATPYTLFFLHRGKEFALRESAKIGNKRPKPSDFILVLQYEWNILSNENKEFYLDAAMKMGYEEREKFIDQNKLSEKVLERFKNNRFNFFNF